MKHAFNVILLTKGTDGDLLPFIGLGKALSARGHTVTLLTHCVHRARVEQTGLDFYALDSFKEYTDFIDSGPLLNRPGTLPEFFKKHLLPKVPSEIDAISRIFRMDKTILVANHLSDLAARLFAEKYRVPFVRVFLAIARVNTLPILALLCKNYIGGAVNTIRSHMGLPKINDWLGWLQAPPHNIGVWPEWFMNAPVYNMENVTPVGFIFHNTEEMGEIPEQISGILEGGRPPILITGGTGKFLGVKFYEVCNKALKNIDRPVVLVTPYSDMLPSILEKNVIPIKSLPFANVLPRVSVVIHHAGTGTLSMALVSGTPQLVMPYGGDRPDTAAHLVQLGVARSLLPPQWKSEIVEKTVNDILHNTNIKMNCLRLSTKLQGSDGAGFASRFIEKVAVQG